MQNQLNKHVPIPLQDTLKDGFIKLQVIPCKLTNSKRRNKSKHLKKKKSPIVLLKEKCAVLLLGKKKLKD